jgi:hypothetical protein
VSLSVVPRDGTTRLQARVVPGPFAPVDATFGAPLAAWTDALAAQPVAIALRASGSPTVLITLATAP